MKGNGEKRENRLPIIAILADSSSSDSSDNANNIDTENKDETSSSSETNTSSDEKPHHRLKPTRIPSPRAKETIIVPEQPEHTPQSLGYLTDSESAVNTGRTRPSSKIAIDFMNSDTSRHPSQMTIDQINNTENDKPMQNEESEDSISIDNNSSTVTFDMNPPSTSYTATSSTPETSTQQDAITDDESDLPPTLIELHPKTPILPNTPIQGDPPTICCNLI